MRLLQRLIVGTAALLSGTMTTSAQTNQYCQAFFNQMSDDTLYSARCAQAGCLDRVINAGAMSVLQSPDGTTHPLIKGQLYNFIYKTPAGGGLPNSLVIVQVKQLDATPRTTPTPSPVQIRRYALDFACYRGRRDVSLPQWPSEAVRGRDVPAIDYDKYDQFHRDGFTNSVEDQFFHNNVHLNYFNGQACVSTLDPVRRAQFLIDDPKNFAGRVERVFISLGATPSKALAAPEAVRRYERLKVLISNYRRGNSPQGCAAFSTKAGGSNSTQIDIVVRDIEQQVQAGFPGIDTSRNWSFLLQ